MKHITEFLLARIAEDEAVAVAAAPHEEWVSVGKIEDGGMDTADGEHVARWSPARVMAECESKRRIVELHAPQYAVAYRESERLLAEAFDQDKVRALASSGPIWPHPASEQTLLALAQPYADHPDFDPAWRFE